MDANDAAVAALRRSTGFGVAGPTPVVLSGEDSLMGVVPSLPSLPAAASTGVSLLTANLNAAPLVSMAYSAGSHFSPNPNSPVFSLADSAPDSPSSIASDLSSGSALSAATSPRSIASLPRHSSTPSLATMAAAATPNFSPFTHFQYSPAPAQPLTASARATPPNFPSLKPALRTSASKSNLSAAAAVNKPQVPAFSLSGTGAGVSSNAAAAAAAEDDEQPSKKKLKANDKSMRRVKSSPAVPITAAANASDDDSDDSDDEDEVMPSANSKVDTKTAAPAKVSKPRSKPISLINPLTGKPKTEAEIKKEKADRRLAKKAEAARQSRKRKKAYVQQLEDKAARLEARLAQLEQNANNTHGTPNPPVIPPSPALTATATAATAGPAAPSTAAGAMAQAVSLHAMHRDEQSDVLARLSVAVSSFVALSGAVPAATANGGAVPTTSLVNAMNSKEKEKEKSKVMDEIKALIERYVVNSRKRQQTVMYYLDRMTDLLVPESAVKVALWGLSQSDAYYEIAGSANAGVNSPAPNTPNSQAQPATGTANIFSSLMATDVGLNSAQLSKLVAEFRAPVSALMDGLRATSSHISTMREYVKTHMAARNRHVDELRHILNPVQIANYLLWLEKNPHLATTLIKSPTASNASGTGAHHPVVVTATIASHATHYSAHGK